MQLDNRSPVKSKHIIDQNQWNQIVEQLPGRHILNTWEWGQIKQAYGWTPIHKVWEDSGGKVEAAALLLKKTIRFPLLHYQASMIYIPRGPLLDWHNLELRKRVIQDLQQLTRENKSIFLKMDPDLPIGKGIPGQEKSVDDSSIIELTEYLNTMGWLFSTDQVQFRNTIWLDLTQPEDDLLMNMKQKTRYNIRLAERKGIKIREGTLEDLDLLYDLYRKTAIRDNFIIRTKDYYHLAWKTLFESNKAIFLLAEYNEQTVGGIILFIFGKIAWYFYGMSTEDYREMMPNHLLQWQAIRSAKAAGCIRYDFWGAPNNFTEKDSMWGVYKFKDGFSGEIVRTIGAWDYPANQQMYKFYTRSLPKLMNFSRSKRRENLRRELP